MGSETQQGTAGEFDLSQYEMADSSVCRIKNMKGDDDFIVEGEPVVVEVYSPGSKPGIRALHKAGLASAARQMRLYRGELDKKDAVMAEEERVAKLAGFTKSISRNFPVAPETIYANPKLNWFTKQIEKHIDKDENFPQGSSGS